MADPLARLRRFLRELKRRNVYKVAVTYAAVVFIGLQAVRLLVPATTLPGWADELLIAIAVLGFPIAIVLAWAFEMTPEGMRRTEVPEGEEAGGSGAYQWLGLALVVLLAGGVWYVTAGDGGEATPEATATRDTTAARTASTARDSAGRPRIAVLPFENIARDTGEAFFAEGMHEEVLNQLSKVAGLEVISRTSVMQYADTDKPVPAISDELGEVDALLEGTVRRAGDRVRITTQLIAAPRDEHLWSNTYDQRLSPDAVFDIQADIARQITGALETRLTDVEEARIREAPTASLGAYDAFLEGRSLVERFWHSRSAEHADRGIRHLRDAIRQDSALAEAHAKLAEGFVAQRVASGQLRWLDSASAGVERARAIDPDLTEALGARAIIAWNRGSLEAAADLFRRVLQREPSNDLAAARLSIVLMRTNRPVEAVRWAHRAVRLAPRTPHRLALMGSRLGVIGMMDAAEAWFQRAIEIGTHRDGVQDVLAMLRTQTDPGAGLRTIRTYLDRNLQTPQALEFAARIALWAGRPSAAKTYLERLQELTRQAVQDASSPSRPERLALGTVNRMVFGLADVQLGRREQGRRLLHEAVDTLRTGRSRDGLARHWGASVWLAGGEAALGDHDVALEVLERSLERAVPVASAPPWLPGIQSNPFFSDLRSDARFREILGEVEERRKEIREEVRQLGVDLYPPGAEPETAR
jgi:TolB-like protein/Tfp pilus assembly protein PilF